MNGHGPLMGTVLPVAKFGPNRHVPVEPLIYPVDINLIYQRWVYPGLYLFMFGTCTFSAWQRPIGRRVMQSMIVLIPISICYQDRPSHALHVSKIWICRS